MYCRLFPVFLLATALLGLSSPANAASAVRDLNAQVYGNGLRAGLTAADAGDTKTEGLAGGGRITFPLVHSFGGSIWGRYAKLRTTLNPKVGNSDPLEQIDRTLGAAVFVRDPRVGRIGLSYARQNGKLIGIGGGMIYSAGTYDDETYTASADYYLENLTVGLSRSRSLEQVHVGSVDSPNRESNSTHARVRWYVTANVSVQVAAGGMEAKDTYRMSTEYQPAFLGNAFSLSAGYSKDVDAEAYTATLGLSYFFGTRVDLKTRDRYFR